MISVIYLSLFIFNNILADEPQCKQEKDHTYSCEVSPDVVVDCLLTDLVDRKDKLQNSSIDDITFQKEVNEIITQDILPTLDIDYMAANIVGRYNWKNSTEKEKARLRTLLQEIAIEEYGDFIRELDKNYPIKFYPPRRINKDNTPVYGILKDDKKSLTVGFYLSCKNTDSTHESWKINDLTVDNISFLDHMRLTVASTIRSSGLKGLNDKLEEARNK